MEKRRSINFSRSSFRSNQSKNDRKESRIVEIVNKSTQCESTEEQKLHQILIDTSPLNDKLVKENDNLKKNIESVQRENTELKEELESQLQIAERIQDAYESAIKERNNLLTMMNDLKKQVNETKAKLGQRLTFKSNQSNNDTTTQSPQQQQRNTMRPPAQEINMESLRNEIKIFKRCMLNNTKLLNNTVLKDKMNDLTRTASIQSDKIVGPSTSIQAIRDKRNLRGLKDKLEKTLTFPDTGRTLDRSKQDLAKTVTQEQNNTEKIRNDGIKNESSSSELNNPVGITICYAKTGKFNSGLSKQNLDISETTKLDLSDQSIPENENLGKIPSKSDLSVTSGKTNFITKNDKTDIQSKNDQSVHSNKLDSINKINQPKNLGNMDLSNENTLKSKSEPDKEVIEASGVTQNTETLCKDETKDKNQNIKHVTLKVDDEDDSKTEDNEDLSDKK